MSGELNGRMFAAVMAAVVAGGGGIAYVQQKAPEAIERKVAYVPRAADARSWGALSKDELVALNARLRLVSAGRVDIFCQGNFCRDLAEDLDEAFESSGFDSYLETPMFDSGKGMGISPASDQAKAVAAAIKDVTSGRIDLKVFDPLDQNGKIVAVAPDRLAIILARRKPN